MKSFVLTILIAITSQNFLKLNSGILNDCSLIRLESSVIKVFCNKNGLHKEYSIDLDQCLTNLNGKLLWADNSMGLYSRYCKQCVVRDTNMSCNCLKADKVNYVSTSVDLSEGLEFKDELLCKHF